jgi:hypothetical protein
MEAKGLCLCFKLKAFDVNLWFGDRVFLTLLLFQKIKNPNYQGKWKAPKIDNPGLFWLLLDVI